MLFKKYKERLKIIKQARGGGSITPEMRRLLAEHEQNGALQIWEECEVVSVEVVIPTLACFVCVCIRYIRC